MRQDKVTPLWPGNEPNFERLLCVFNRQEPPDRVPFIELGVDVEVIDAVLGEEPIVFDVADRKVMEEMLSRRIRFCQTVCYDYVWAHPVINFPRNVLTANDTAKLHRGQRSWVDENKGVIETVDDFENYPWPTPESVDYYGIEYVAAHLPDGMKIISGTSGILEWVMWLMGFVPFSTSLYDQPELVEVMFHRIGALFESVYKTLADMPQVGAIILADDMGYKSGPFIKPAFFRQYVFPHQRRLGEVAHARRLPFLLHACGNLEIIMDDLIEIVGIDAKHSFEDVSYPVTQAKRLYGNRIAILGGVDMHMISSSSEEQVRAYTRRLLQECMPGGGYALGTGNTVANYIPVRNYLAMLDEGIKIGRYT